MNRRWSGCYFRNFIRQIYNSDLYSETTNIQRILVNFICRRRDIESGNFHEILRACDSINSATLDYFLNQLHPLEI